MENNILLELKLVTGETRHVALNKIQAICFNFDERAGEITNAFVAGASNYPVSLPSCSLRDGSLEILDIKNFCQQNAILFKTDRNNALYDYRGVDFSEHKCVNSVDNENLPSLENSFQEEADPLKKIFERDIRINRVLVFPDYLQNAFSSDSETRVKCTLVFGGNFMVTVHEDIESLERKLGPTFLSFDWKADAHEWERNLEEALFGDDAPVRGMLMDSRRMTKPVVDEGAGFISFGQYREDYDDHSFWRLERTVRNDAVLLDPGINFGGHPHMNDSECRPKPLELNHD